MEEDSKLENVLRNGALIVGIILLVGSMFLSYDGFDQSVSGGNTQYGFLASAIGIALAIAVTLLEFIVSSRIEGLNTTLKVLGLVAYVYSIYTNFLGAQNLMGMEMKMAAVTALFMDIVPEPLIAWGLGEAVMHDLFANLGKIATSSSVSGKKKGGGGGGNQNRQQNNQQHNQHKGNGGGGHFPSSKPGFQSHGGGGERRRQLEAQFGGNGKSAVKEPNTKPRMFEDDELE